jgi:tetratricopeptide (TPR) repeat protein
VSEVGRERAHYGVELVRTMTTYWYRFGYAAEGRGWLDRALEVAGAEDSIDTIDVLHGLGIMQLQQGDAEPAAKGLRRALEMARRLGDRSLEARLLNSLAITLRVLGEITEGRRLLERSAQIAKEIGDLKRESTALSNLAVLLLDAGNWPEALSAAREAVSASSALDDAWAQTTDECNLTMALLRVEGPETALRYLSEVTPRALAMGDAELTVSIVEMFSAIVAELGDARLAARLLAASDRHRESLGMPRTKPDQDHLDRSFNDSLRAGREWSDGYDQGRGLSIDAAIEVALSASTSNQLVTGAAD